MLKYITFNSPISLHLFCNSPEWNIEAENIPLNKYEMKYYRLWISIIRTLIRRWLIIKILFFPSPWPSLFLFSLFLPCLELFPFFLPPFLYHFLHLSISSFLSSYLFRVISLFLSFIYRHYLSTQLQTETVIQNLLLKNKVTQHKKKCSLSSYVTVLFYHQP